MDPIFSIIIPSYNHEKYIGDAINSVINQTFQDWELIVVDDGSKDGSLDVVAQFKDPRIKVLTQANHDAPFTINRGLKEASGKYFAILNSDDLIEPDKLEKCLQSLRSGSDFLFGKLKAIDQDGQPMDQGDYRVVWMNERLNNSNEPFSLEKLLTNINFLMTTSNYVFTRKVFETVGSFHEYLRYSHDFDYVMRVVASGFEITFIPEYLGSYRIHSDNTISKGRQEAYLEPSYSMARTIRENGKLRNRILKTILTQPIYSDIVVYFLALETKEMEDIIVGRDVISKNELLDKIAVFQGVTNQREKKEKTGMTLPGISSPWNMVDFIRTTTKNVDGRVLRIFSDGSKMISERRPDYVRNIENIINYSRNNNENISVEFSGKISVVMLTLNRLTDTKQSVDALYENVPYPFELLILDNASSDEEMISYLHALREEKGNVKVFFEKANLGCAGGRKKLFKEATGEYVLSVDNDIIITPFTVQNLISVISGNSDIAGVCCKAIFPDGKIQFNGGRMEIDRSGFIRFSLIDGGKRFDNSETFNTRECDWIPGGATLWRRSILEMIEIDDKMKGSHEDNDFSIVVRKSGYVLYNCPRAMVIHNHIHFNKNVRADRRYMESRYDLDRIKGSLIWFYEKHGLMIRDGLLTRFGINIDDNSQIISFFRGLNGVTAETNKDEIAKFLLSADRASKKNIYDSIAIGHWDSMYPNGKKEALRLLQERGLLKKWIQILYVNERFEEVAYFSEIVFAGRKVEDNRTLALYINRLYNGGRERVVQLIANNLARNGWKIAIFTLEDPNALDYDLDGRIERIVLPKNASKIPSFLAGKMQELSIQTISSHNWLNEKEVLIFAYLRACGIRVCYSDHIGFRERIMLQNDVRLVGTIVNSSNILNGITCLSRLETSVWRSFGQKVAFMPNPINIFPENGNKVLNERKSNQIVWVGRLERNQKQPDHAIRAFSALFREKKDAKLVIVGTEDGANFGEYYRELQELCKNLNCESGVEFVGFSDDVSRYLMESSVHWMTSAYEGFPMVWAEAKYCGTPTVLYDMPWVELNGDGSIVVPQGDYEALAAETLKLLGDRALLGELSEKTRNDLINRFDPKFVMGRWESYYLQMNRLGVSEFSSEAFPDLKEESSSYLNRYMQNIFSIGNMQRISKKPDQGASNLTKIGSPNDLKNRLAFAIYSPKKFIGKYARKVFK